MKCRHCQAEVELPFIDLATAPPSNAYLRPEQLSAPETFFPLRVRVCTACWLVQTEDYADHAQLFASDYAYFSSMSSAWLQHSARYVAAVTERFGLDESSYVIEIASNDGYLLQYIRQAGIGCLGIEPTASTAAAARAKGIEVIEEFFGEALGRRLAGECRQADLMIANNVLAHVPGINDFVIGFAQALKPQGVVTFEFPHLMRMVDECQFDTIYHEHFSYLSLVAVQRVLEHNGLGVFDVEELPTHGGSLRVFAQRLDTGHRAVKAAVGRLLQRERTAGVESVGYYEGFQSRADDVRDGLMSYLIEARRQGRRVGAYGAAAKGNTLLNYAGVRTGLLPWVVDRSPGKHGMYMPGSRVPIVDEAHLRRERPDDVLLLPWNLKDELMTQLEYIRDWGGRFVVAVPRIEVL